MQFGNDMEIKFSLEELEKIGLGRRGNCQRCEYPVPRMADIACGKWGMEESKDSGTFVEICSLKGRELIEQAVLSNAVKLSSPTQEQIEMRARKEKQKIISAKEVQKREFSELNDKFYWISQFENCIKCYSCRDVCPICHCKRCVLERDKPATVVKGVVPPPFTFGATRVLHVACQCVNCGQCDDVCSADISLSRLVHNLNKESSKLFKYEAGIDRESPYPLCNIPEDEKMLQTTDLPYG
jgi:formate dehydrogenase subunit beta